MQTCEIAIDHYELFVINLLDNKQGSLGGVCVTKYLFRREICSAGTYFTENLFCRNFLNEKLVPGTYFIGKFIPPM